MENFKFNLLVIIVFIILGGIVYWSVSSMNNDVYYTRDITNAEPIAEDTAIANPLDDLTEVTPSEPSIPEPENTEPESVKVSSEYSELIVKIEKLVEDRVYMKKGSSGSRVGTIQEFLNIYHDTSKRVDNDYGPGMVEDVKKFQTAEELSADGQIGPDTYNKMIDWLKNN